MARSVDFTGRGQFSDNQSRSPNRVPLLPPPEGSITFANRAKKYKLSPPPIYMPFSAR